MSRGVFWFWTLIFDGHLGLKRMLRFLDTMWFRGGGMAKHDITKALLAFNAKALLLGRTNRMGSFALSLSSQCRIVLLRFWEKNKLWRGKPCPLGGNTY